MKEIQITQGKVALVDDDDFEIINSHPWFALEHRNTFYAFRWIVNNGKRVRLSMHHEVFGKPPAGKVTDHKDGNGLNNQKGNLRFLTNRQNRQNKSGWKTSCDLPGVSFAKDRGKWMAKARINGKQTYLGLYDSPEKAAAAYAAKMTEIGEEVICAQ